MKSRLVHSSALLLLLIHLKTSLAFVLPTASRLALSVSPLFSATEDAQQAVGISSSNNPQDQENIWKQLKACAKVTARDPSALPRATHIWQNFLEHQAAPIDAKCYHALMETYVYSQRPDAVQNVEDLLQSMREQKATVSDETLGLVMEAYTQARDWLAAEQFWESTVLSGDQDLTTILLNKRLRTLGVQGKANVAEALLRQLLEDASSSSIINAKSWVHVLRAHANKLRESSNSHEKDKLFTHLHNLMQEMEQSECQPTTDAYTTILMAMNRLEISEDKASQAEAILFGLLNTYKRDPTNEDMRPNADTFFYVYQACRGQHYPKVEMLWQLQCELWRQAANADAKRRLVPSVRNLNAALAVLSRSRFPNKAHKAYQLVQQLAAIRTECETQEAALLLPPLTSDLGTYKNLLRTCAFTPRATATPRERKEALEIALSARQVLFDEFHVDGKDATLVYKLLLQAVGNLMENAQRRDELASELFQECADKGLVDDSVLAALERAASKRTSASLLRNGASSTDTWSTFRKIDAKDRPDLPDFGKTSVEIDKIKLTAKKWRRKDLFGSSMVQQTLEEMENDKEFQDTAKRYAELGAEKVTKEERTRRRRALDSLGIPSFAEFLEEKNISHQRKQPKVLQINIGLYCNQACAHCHVESSPLRTEMMTSETAAKCLELLKSTPSITTLDITGGAPELNANFRYLVKMARQFRPDLEIIDRCNLTVLQEPGQEDLVKFLASQKVRIVASLPCYSQENVNQQRGSGVFERSIAALLALNEAGYGVEGSGLHIDLVYNPLGAFLPPEQGKLEVQYKKQLQENFGILFNSLFTMTNMPIKRFADFLHRRDELKYYMELLVRNFNADTVESLMCVDTVSIGYDGSIYDCDFNQQLGYGVGNQLTIFDLEDLDLTKYPIRTDNHCFACTAGMGSS